MHRFRILKQVGSTCAEQVDLDLCQVPVDADQVRPSDVFAAVRDAIERMPVSDATCGSLSRSMTVNFVPKDVCDVACLDLIDLVNESVAATGLSHGDLRDLMVSAVADRLLFVVKGRVEAEPETRGSEPRQLLEQARASLKAFLLQLIKLGRRSSAARQSAAECTRLASRSAAASSDTPSAGIVLLSTRAPRGPNTPRMTSTQVIGGELVAAA